MSHSDVLAGHISILIEAALILFCSTDSTVIGLDIAFEDRIFLVSDD